jgi:hypothetical protein
VPSGTPIHAVGALFALSCSLPTPPLLLSLFLFHQLGLQNHLKKENTNKGLFPEKTTTVRETDWSQTPNFQNSVGLVFPHLKLPKAKLLPDPALWLGEQGPVGPVSSA